MKRFMFFKTIRGRLLALMVIVEMAMLALLVLNSLRLLHDAMSDQASTMASQYHPVLEAAITAPLAQRDYATVQYVLDESRSARGVEYVVVLDRDGRMIASSGWEAGTPLPEARAVVPLLGLTSTARYDLRETISFRGQRLGTLQFGINLSQIVSARRQLLLQGTVIAAAEVVLSGVLVFLLGHWLTRHLKTLTRASVQVARGNLAPPPLPEGEDDLGQLGVAFNTMSRVLAERVAELTAARDVAESSGERLRAIADSANDAIIMMDPYGAISFWNPAAERILGYSAREIIGSDLHKLLVPERYHADFYAALPGFLRTGEGAALGRPIERSAIRRDGREVAVAVSISAVMLNGEWHSAGILRDITEQKRINATLRKLSSAVEHCPVSIIITDRAGRIEYINPKFSQMSGYGLEEVLGKNPRLFKGPDHPPEFYRELWETILAGNEWSGEFHNRRKDGSLVWLMASISPIFDENGVITHFVGVREEIEKQKQLQADLAGIARLEKEARDHAEEANRAKSDFLASMSHEIRTPLNAIIGMSELLSEGSLTVEQSEYLAVIHSAGETLQGLIGDILELSKIEAGMLKLDPAPFCLPDCVQKLMAMVVTRSTPKGILLTSSLGSGVPEWLVGDAFRLRQVLLNLLANAVKFTEQGGSVHLQVDALPRQENGVMLRFSVTDTGIGIPSEKLGVIFERFIQADSSTTRRFGGSGLGLAISRRLVEAMAGEIGVESTPGEGSCFHFTARFGFPDTAPSAGRGEAPPAIPLQCGSLKILIVDDNKDNRNVLNAYFRRTSHTVDSAEDGREALEKIRQGGYDLVLLDMEMPVMDGYTTARLVRQWERETGRSPLPLIALSANAFEEDRARSIEAGCTTHVTKPIQKQALLELVATYTRSAGGVPEGDGPA